MRHWISRYLVPGHVREFRPLGHAVIEPVASTPGGWVAPEHPADVQTPAQIFRAGGGLVVQGRATGARVHGLERLHYSCRAELTGSVCAACCTLNDFDAG
jgi:hypothetical protein